MNTSQAYLLGFFHTIGMQKKKDKFSINIKDLQFVYEFILNKSILEIYVNNAIIFTIK